MKLLWLLRERLASPVSAVIYETSGSVWAESCVACGHEKHWRTAGGAECCSRCGLPWKAIEGRVPKSTKQRRGGNAAERSFHDLGRCVAILNHVPEPARTLYEQHLSPLGGGMAYALDAARKLGVCGAMSEYGYYKNLRIARELVRERIEYAQAAALTRRTA